jgi:hypothetical protein
MTPHRLYIGTIGEGVFRSLDHGVSFRRACEGMFVECHVRALTVHPRDAKVLYLGSELGLFRSTDGADSWTKLPAPLDGLQVWSLWIDPVRPEAILAGTCPSRLFRSSDGGASWEECVTGMVRECPRILHTRVTALAGDATEPGSIWAGVEIDALYHSRDGGKNWRPAGTGLSSRDIHALAVIPGKNGRRLLASTNNDLNLSDDAGETWRPLGAGQRLPFPYFRGLAQICGRPEVLLAGLGDGPPGWIGGVARSEDGGSTWRSVPLPAPANSTVWTFAVHAADPNLVYAASVSGQVFRSTDAGQSWEKLAREFGEIRALAWAPT